MEPAPDCSSGQCHRSGGIPEVPPELRRSNPFCYHAPEIFGMMTLEQAKEAYPHFFELEDNWRLPTPEDSVKKD